MNYDHLAESQLEFFTPDLSCFKDCAQISLLILNEFKQLINFFSPWDYQKIYGDNT